MAKADAALIVGGGLALVWLMSSADRKPARAGEKKSALAAPAAAMASASPRTSQGSSGPTLAAMRQAAARATAIPQADARAAVAAARATGTTITSETHTAPTQAQGSAITSALRALHPATAAQARGEPMPAEPTTAATQPAKKQKRKVAAPASVNIALARQTAADVAAHVRNKGRKYTHKVVQDFQARAGMKADGLYGPATASALRYFGANAPAPLYKGVNARYVPPTA